MFQRARDLFDPFLALLLATVLAATLLPARGGGVAVFDRLADLAILLLFFLHGAKLSRTAILAGAGKWRLHLAVLATSFVLYPVCGLAARAAAAAGLAPAMAPGLLFLSLLPSTVQSSIAFTSIAGGDVPAAIASASLSNILGIVVTPLLAGLLMGAAGGGGGVLHSILAVGAQLLLPFAIGHLARPLVGGFVDRHKALVARVDRGSILLLVYTAFSAAVVGGTWRQTDLPDLAVALVLGAAMLAVVLTATRWAARRLGWTTADEIVLRFCGSKKSLVSGVPLASAIFPAAQVGLLLLPLMIFHQMQLMVCSVLARRYALAELETAV